MKRYRSPFLFALLVSIAAPAAAQDNDPSKVKLVVHQVAGSVSMIEGVEGFAGGNVGVSVGPDGVFIIDDELAQMSTKLQAALATLSKQPVRFVINTHWHGDHTGGNAALGQAGAIILAHDNVRLRLSAAELLEKSKQATAATSPTIAASAAPKTAPSPKPGVGLPVVTFAQDVTLHLNGDTVHVFHVPPAHTDGDVLVHFTKANVIHTGDLFRSTGYPFVDIDAGGNFEGFIAAADTILAVAGNETRIIPGHGAVSGRAEVQAWRNMLDQLRQRVRKLIAEGKTLEQAVAAKPSADLDAKVGSDSQGADRIVAAAYKSLTASKPGADKAPPPQAPPPPKAGPAVTPPAPPRPPAPTPAPKLPTQPTPPTVPPPAKS
jgi:cyclase